MDLSNNTIQCLIHGREGCTMYFHSNRDFNASLPNALLMKYVLYYNVVFPKPNMFKEYYTLMPNACGTLSISYNGNDVSAELWGASTTPNLIGCEPNQYQVMLLIQLSAYGLYQLTNYHQAEFADKRISLKDVDKKLCALLCQSFETANNITELFYMCDRILYHHMEHNVVSNALITATNTISDSHGQILVSELARIVGYSDRQLNRLFLKQIGMIVKRYTRISRLNYVLKHIQQSPCSLATLAQRAGYFDQTHFNKDFRAICGVSPKMYIEKMSDFYYDGSDIFNTISSKED